MGIKSALLKYWLGMGAGIVLGLIFLLAGGGKLLSQAEVFSIFFTPFADFLLPFAPVLYRWLPVVEIAIGLLLITGILARPSASLALVLIIVFMANNSWLISHGFGDEPCGCFGALEEIAQLRLLIIGALSLDVVILVLALATLFWAQVSFLTLIPGSGPVGPASNGRGKLNCPER